LPSFIAIHRVSFIISPSARRARCRWLFNRFPLVFPAWRADLVNALFLKVEQGNRRFSGFLVTDRSIPPVPGLLSPRGVERPVQLLHQGEVFCGTNRIAMWTGRCFRAMVYSHVPGEGTRIIVRQRLPEFEEDFLCDLLSARPDLSRLQEPSGTPLSRICSANCSNASGYRCA